MPPPIKSIQSGTTIIANAFTNMGKDMAGFAHKMEELGMGVSDILSGFSDLIKKGSEYTLGMEDSARVLQRGTILMGKNLEEFNRYSDGIRKQSFMFSDISGKAMKESQQYIAGLQATLKGFGADGSIDLTGKQFVELDRAAREMAASLTPEAYEDAKGEYDKLAKTLSQNEKDALNLTATMGKMSLTMGVSAAEFNSFVDELGRMNDLSIADTTSVATIMEDAQKKYGMTFSESSKVVQANQEKIMGIELPARKEFIKGLLQSAAEIKKAGIDFVQGAKAISGDQGDVRVERAAMLAAAGQGTLNENLALMQASDLGNQKAGEELNRRQVGANSKFLGDNYGAMSNVNNKLINMNPEDFKKLGKGELETIFKESVTSALVGSTLGGAFAENSFQRAARAGQTKRTKRGMEGLEETNPDNIMPEAGAARGMMTSGEITTSRTTELLGEILPESLNKFNDALRDVISFVDIAASGVDTVKGLYGSIDKAVGGIGTVGFDLANIGSTMTKAEWGVAKEEAFDSSTSMKALRGILAGTGLAAILGPKLLGGKTGNMDQKGPSLDDILGGKGTMEKKGENPLLDDLLNRNTGTMDKRVPLVDDLLNRNTGTMDKKAANRDLDELLRTGHSGHGSSIDEMYKLKAHSVDELLKLRGVGDGKLGIIPTARAMTSPKIDTDSRQNQSVTKTSVAQHTENKSATDKLQEMIDVLSEVASHLRNPRVAQEPNC